MSTETHGRAAATDADWLGLHGARVLVAGAGGIGGACALAYARRRGIRRRRRSRPARARRARRRADARSARATS